MRLAVPKETAEGERRVALVPEVVKKLSARGIEVVVQSGAGERRDDPRRRLHRGGCVGDRRPRTDLGRGRGRRDRAAHARRTSPGCAPARC